MKFFGLNLVPNLNSFLLLKYPKVILTKVLLFILMYHIYQQIGLSF